MTEAVSQAPTTTTVPSIKYYYMGSPNDYSYKRASDTILGIDSNGKCSMYSLYDLKFNDQVSVVDSITIPPTESNGKTVRAYDIQSHCDICKMSMSHTQQCHTCRIVCCDYHKFAIVSCDTCGKNFCSGCRTDHQYQDNWVMTTCKKC